jgi:predicted permease
LTFRVSLPEAEYPDAETTRAFHRSFRERLSVIPGVRAAALASALPLAETKNASPIEPVDRPVGEGQLAPVVNIRQISPGYFEAMGITLTEGRELTADDGGDQVRSVVVSETLARAFWPGESAMGRRLRSQGDTLSWEVVGVAAEVRFERLDRPPEVLLYLPMVFGNPPNPQLARQFAVVLHVSGNPLAFVAAAREALREVDPRLPMVDPTTVEKTTRDAMAATSFTALLLGVAAGIALLLGSVGIYGVISYVVTRRTQEIGVRMALGAPAAQVLREVVRQGMVLTGVGVAVGLGGAWAVSRVLASLLYGVSATDPATYVVTTVALSGIAALASWFPARRASRVDPMVALRAE